MTAITTSNSINVKARGGRKFFCIAPGLCPIRVVCTMLSFSCSGGCVSRNPLQCRQHARHYASLPLGHLLGKRALCAIGVVTHAKVFVNLKQTLLVGDRP